MWRTLQTETLSGPSVSVQSSTYCLNLHSSLSHQTEEIYQLLPHLCICSSAGEYKAKQSLLEQTNPVLSSLTITGAARLEKIILRLKCGAMTYKHTNISQHPRINKKITHYDSVNV